MTKCRVAATARVTFGIGDGAYVGISACLPGATLSSVESDADALAVHRLARPALLILGTTFCGIRAGWFGLCFGLGFRSGFGRRQTLPAVVIWWLLGTDDFMYCWRTKMRVTWTCHCEVQKFRVESLYDQQMASTIDSQSVG